MRATERNEEERAAWREKASSLSTDMLVFIDECGSNIEEAFSKLKTALRRAGARTREALQEAIARALLTITAQDAQGWFQHCGYLLPGQERKS